MKYFILKNESKDRHFVKGLKRFALAAAAVGCMMIMNPQEVKADVTWIQLQDYANNPDKNWICIRISCLLT